MENEVRIIAEAGVNHNGSLDRARQLVKTASDAGADLIKFQTFKAEAIITRSAPKAEYQVEATSRKETQHEMLKRLELDNDNRHPKHRAGAWQRRKKEFYDI